MTDTRNSLEYLICGLITGFVGIVLFAVQVYPDWKKVLLAIGVASMIASSALAAGVFVGFLFGLPRTLQPGFFLNSSEDKQSKSNHGYRVNANLEEISDWLTKILVGIGLTQIPGILTAFENYSNYVRV